MLLGIESSEQPEISRFSSLPLGLSASLLPARPGFLRGKEGEGAQLVVGILTACEERLMEMEDMEDMVEVLKVEVPHWKRERLQQLLTRSFASTWNARQLRVLEQTEGVESVVDAVARVARGSQVATSPLLVYIVPAPGVCAVSVSSFISQTVIFLGDSGCILPTRFRCWRPFDGDGDDCTNSPPRFHLPLQQVVQPDSALVACLVLLEC